MVWLYTYESSPAEGWVYDELDNPDYFTIVAIQFGINLLEYVMNSPPGSGCLINFGAGRIYSQEQKPRLLGQ